MSHILMNREIIDGCATHFIPQYLFHVFDTNISIWRGLIGINTSLTKIGLSWTASLIDHSRIAVGGSCRVKKIEIAGGVEALVAPRYNTI